MGFQFAVRATNHGVVVSSARQQQRTRKGVAREPAKHFTDSIRVRPGAAGRTDTTKQQTPLQREVWTNKKVTEFIASTTTRAASQSGQHNRWLAAEMCGEHADTSSTGLEEDPALPENPVRPKNALHSHERRYSLTSGRVPPASQRKAEVSTEYSGDTRLRQPTISGKTRFGPLSTDCT